jgi:predicted transcriptional regulator
MVVQDLIDKDNIVLLGHIDCHRLTDNQIEITSEYATIMKFKDEFITRLEFSRSEMDVKKFDVAASGADTANRVAVLFEKMKRMNDYAKATRMGSRADLIHLPAAYKKDLENPLRAVLITSSDELDKLDT